MGRYFVLGYRFQFTIAQEASVPGKYTIHQPRFKANIISSRWYIARIFQISLVHLVCTTSHEALQLFFASHRGPQARSRVSKRVSQLSGGD